jgi:RimJ/RimL family protein N-acetyltransferase
VDPAFRRRGIAAMIKAVLTRAAAVNGLRQVSLSVATPQAAARALYDSLGFRIFGVERRSLRVGDGYVDEEHRVAYLDA